MPFFYFKAHRHSTWKNIQNPFNRLYIYFQWKFPNPSHATTHEHKILSSHNNASHFYRNKSRIYQENISFLHRNNVWSRDFIIWKTNSGLWAGLWNQRVWADYEQLLRPAFLRFYERKINLKLFWKYFKVHPEKLHRKKVNKSQKNSESIFYEGKTSFFRAKNLSVNT